MIRQALSLALCTIAALCCAPASAAPAHRSAPPLRLYVLDCGTLRTGDVSRYDLKPAEVRHTDMAVPCYLVRHGKDWLMFDTGLGDSHFGKADHIVTLTLEVREQLGPQLARLGLKPSDIGRVAVSHFHFDHVGNLAALTGANLLVQRAEAEAVRRKPYPFTPEAAVRRLDAPNVTLLDGDFDVFGDGSVILLATPGHSPGHQSLRVNLRRTGPVILTGDLYHYPEEVTLGRVPPTEAQSQTPASRARIQQILVHDHAQLWILHDLERYVHQRHSPRFYD